MIMRNYADDEGCENMSPISPQGNAELQQLSGGSNGQVRSPSPPPFVLDKSKKDDIKRQTLEEGLKPAVSDGGVAFFIPVTDKGLQPQGGSVDITERITKNKKSPLKYEEKMMLADINRQVHISERKEFAIKDLQKVKVRKCDKLDKEFDELDKEFGL